MVAAVRAGPREAVVAPDGVVPVLDELRVAVGVNAGDGARFGRGVPLVDQDRRASADVVGEVGGHQRLLIGRLSVLAQRRRHTAGHLADAVAAVERDERLADGAERQRAGSLRRHAFDPADRLEQRRRHVDGVLLAAVLPRAHVDRQLREELVVGEERIVPGEIHRGQVELAVLGGLVGRRRFGEGAGGCDRRAVVRRRDQGCQQGERERCDHPQPGAAVPHE